MQHLFAICTPYNHPDSTEHVSCVWSLFRLLSSKKKKHSSHSDWTYHHKLKRWSTSCPNHKVRRVVMRGYSLHGMQNGKFWFSSSTHRCVNSTNLLLTLFRTIEQCCYSMTQVIWMSKRVTWRGRQDKKQCIRLKKQRSADQELLFRRQEFCSLILMFLILCTSMEINRLPEGNHMQGTAIKT